MDMTHVLAIASLAAASLVAGCTDPCTIVENDDGSATLSCADGTSTTVSSGTSCTVESNEDGTSTISCEDGTTATVTDGGDGSDGTSCSVESNDNGTATISCEDGTTVTLSDGSGCSVNTDGVTGIVEVSCDDGTSAVLNDQDSDGVADGLDACPLYPFRHEEPCPCPEWTISGFSTQSASNGVYVLDDLEERNGGAVWRKGDATLAYGTVEAGNWEITATAPSRPGLCDGPLEGGPDGCSPWREWRGGGAGFQTVSVAFTCTDD